MKKVAVWLIVLMVQIASAQRTNVLNPIPQKVLTNEYSEGYSQFYMKVIAPTNSSGTASAIIDLPPGMRGYSTLYFVIRTSKSSFNAIGGDSIYLTYRPILSGKVFTSKTGASTDQTLYPFNAQITAANPASVPLYEGFGTGAISWNGRYFFSSAHNLLFNMNKGVEIRADSIASGGAVATRVFYSVLQVGGLAQCDKIQLLARVYSTNTADTLQIYGILRNQ